MSRNLAMLMFATVLRSQWRSALIIAAMCVVTGCAAQRERLAFPANPCIRDSRGMWYQLDGSAVLNFALLNDAEGRLRTLTYDDDSDGDFDREIRINAANAKTPPHLIIMLDSIPYRAIADAYAAGRLTWFDPPQKVIPPFPTMSGVIFTSILHAERLPGIINRYYDRQRGRTDNLIVRRALGHTNPWHEQLHYRAKYWENGLAFLRPRHWFRRELARAKRAFDESSEPVTIVYLASTSGMLSRYGEQGLHESIDGVEQLCVQLLHERNGALHISILADHGHNLMPGTRIELEKTLRDAGFRPTGRLKRDRDVVIENDGLVNYIGMHTNQAAAVAEAVAARSEVQLAMYRDGDRVIVRSALGTAAIERRAGRFRYVPLDADVLEYEPVLDQLIADGRMDASGFVADRDWFHATIDHEWPDAPPRLWNAFDGLVANTPDVMLTLHDGYCTGMGFLELFITMASTHGGLNQINSATFVMSTTGRAIAPLRSAEILKIIAPERRSQAESLVDANSNDGESP